MYNIIIIIIINNKYRLHERWRWWCCDWWQQSILLCKCVPCECFRICEMYFWFWCCVVWVLLVYRCVVYLSRSKTPEWHGDTCGLYRSDQGHLRHQIAHQQQSKVEFCPENERISQLRIKIINKYNIKRKEIYQNFECVCGEERKRDGNKELSVTPKDIQSQVCVSNSYWKILVRQEEETYSCVYVSRFLCMCIE